MTRSAILCWALIAVVVFWVGIVIGAWLVTR